MKKYQKRLKTLSDLRRYLSAQINQLDQGTIDENRLRCVAYALSILASIVKDGDLERRVESLEKQAAENQPGRMGK
jgi:cell division protein FtsB